MLKRFKEPLIVAVAIGLALLAFTLSAHSSFSAGPVTIGASFRPGAGRTVLALPPFGSVAARTHAAPMRVEFRLEDLAISQVQSWVDNGVPNGTTLTELRRQLQAGVALAYGIGVLAAALVSLIVLLAARFKPQRALVIAGVLSGVLLVVGAWGLLGFDEAAFSQPTYRGALTYAPGVVATVQDRLTAVGELKGKVFDVARDLASYYGTSQVFASGGSMSGTIKVLHISDTHLDPVGAELATQLADAFDVAFVIHTGDINIYGTSVEASVAVAEMDTSRPLLFVPGNHDSPAISRALATLENVTVLENTSTVVAGLRVFGVPDPVSRGYSVEPDKAQMSTLAQTVADSLRESIAKTGLSPDIIALHNPAMQKPFAGMAPIVLSGHTHTPALSFKDDTWWLNAGTTGGVAFGGAEGAHTAYSAAVLYYTQTTPHRLIAIDRIEVNGTTRETSLTRTTTSEAVAP